MAMLEYNEIVERKFIVLEGTPYEVIDSHVFRKQQRKPVNATKLKNLITGKVAEISFHVSEKVEEAEIDKKDVKFLFANKGEYWFCETDDASKRFKIEEDMIGVGAKFMKTNAIISLLMFRDKIIGVKMPIKVELKVTEAQDATKGNTAQGATKSVTLETGATVFVPMFIKEGEIIRVNTETGEYTERVGNSF
ncbi:MAG: elongation factor P [Minisyncoccota bacterium]